MSVRELEVLLQLINDRTASGMNAKVFECHPEVRNVRLPLRLENLRVFYIKPKKTGNKMDKLIVWQLTW